MYASVVFCMCTNIFYSRIQVNTVRLRHGILTLIAGIFASVLLTGPALAHVSEQGFVLLLPTGLYIRSGIWVVALTALALVILPGKSAERIFSVVALPGIPAPRWEMITSILSFLLLCALIYAGLAGSRDPLVNPLPLYIWTVLWIILVILQALIGDIWSWINPWTGLARIARGASADTPLVRLPSSLGCWPASLGLLAFSAFALADPAPDDPGRLAVFVAAYWFANFLAILIFGARQWLACGEFLTVLMTCFSQMSAWRPGRYKTEFGVPGWQLTGSAPVTTSSAVFVLLLLGTGSFDGLNETFWWLAQIDVNPLEFPGRSAVIRETITGLLGANILLIIVFLALVWIGHQFAIHQSTLEQPISFPEAFCRLSLSLLPIALAYHFAHYLTVFLVNGQYALAALSDPFSTGADILNLGTYFVSTGFFNTRDSVQLIFLSQAGAVVLGHVIAILVAHSIALRLYGQNRVAVISQLPVIAFMILYTFLGLWLLAAPKGA